MKAALLSLALCALSACSSFPPLALGYTFPMTVSVSTPGWSAPVAVAPSAAVNTPVLMVPVGAATAVQAVVAATKTTAATVVPVIEAPVTAPVLAVPIAK
jgi:hypothetical protein